MKATDIRLSYTEDNKPEITLTLDLPRRDVQKALQEAKGVLAKGKPLEVTIRQHRCKRGHTANSYNWVLCQKIAEVVRSTKEEVYKEFIKRVGQFKIIPTREDAVEPLIERWTSIGLGWHAEALGDSNADGYTDVIAYFGSSVYLSSEMAILLDEITSECKELGIETLPPDEIDRMKDLWGQ